jgi:hypothetical protein
MSICIYKLSGVFKTCKVLEMFEVLKAFKIFKNPIPSPMVYLTTLFLKQFIVSRTGSIAVFQALLFATLVAGVLRNRTKSSEIVCFVLFQK